MAIKCSAKTRTPLFNQKIDREIAKIINQQMQRSLNLVKLHKSKIEQLSKKLLEKDILSFMDVNEILGERPFEPKENFKRFLEEINRKDQSGKEQDSKTQEVIEPKMA